MTAPIALVGIGKIAADQHVPAIADSPDWHLDATVSRHGTVDGIPAYSELAAMLEAHPQIGTVSLCLPPQPRFAYAKAAIEAGRHVMLEKPPGQSIGEVQALAALARARGVTLYATWHSRMAPGVAPAAEWLAQRSVASGRVTWKEDVRRWHPGQAWIFEPGGMGVLDPGINALSILTAILPTPAHVIGAELDVPSNCQTPIAARLSLSQSISVDLDWRQTGPQTWDIAVETPDGTLCLHDGGARLVIDGVPVETPDHGEYPGLYRRMAKLVAAGTPEVDLAPMILVADALPLGRRIAVDPFEF